MEPRSIGDFEKQKGVIMEETFETTEGFEMTDDATTDYEEETGSGLGGILVGAGTIAVGIGVGAFIKNRKKIANWVSTKQEEQRQRLIAKKEAELEELRKESAEAELKKEAEE